MAQSSAATAWPTDASATSPAQFSSAPAGVFTSSPQRLLATAARLGDKPAYFVRDDQGWQATTWTAYAAQARCAARALLALGIKHGDAVAILGFNRPEWAIMAYAAMMVGAVPTGIYWTSSADDIEYILNHSKAPLLLVDDQERYLKVQSCREGVVNLRQVVMMKGATVTSPEQMSWDDFLAQDNLALEARLDRCIAAIQARDVGSLIYTSGTTGPAKAVVLSHANLAWTAAALSRTLQATERDRVLSYLPFAHIAEQLGCLHSQAFAGFSVYFARSMEELGEHLKEVRPTYFFGVPRVWEKMQAAIQMKLQQATGLKAVMARWAMRVGQRWNALDIEGRRPGAWLTLQKHLANRLIYRKIKVALGFDQARMLISAAAPIAVENLHFFAGLDMVVREVYGQSEVSGPTSVSTVGNTRLGSVGKPLQGTEVRIADDGEIQVRGPHLFQGYAGRPEATAEAMDGDWLRSGDLGHIDAQGFLYITGRKKDLIITSGGKNISPGNLEAALMDMPLVEHAVVCGDGRHFLTALLTLDEQVLAEFARTHGLPETGLREHPRVLEALQHSIDAVNTHHARVAQIRRFAVLPKSLTIEGGELTPTLKVKRKVVSDRNRAVIEAFYQA
ncbi:MAG: long-chain fatty acid--CoA ligase [Burkholderiales bacterium]|nr:long-chain fatty acid--CoA ligase [Burkholderiales bacterium]